MYSFIFMILKLALVLQPLLMLVNERRLFMSFCISIWNCCNLEID